MNFLETPRRKAGAALSVIALLIAALGGTNIATATASAPSAKAKAKPTIVLVHGAWADSGAWNRVTRRLQKDGFTVRAVATPLRSLASDAEYVKTFVKSVPGPVILVGHSFGGAIVTDAATGVSNIKALVYVDAFAPAKGESVFQLAGATSALANPDPTQVFSFSPTTLPPTPTSDLYVLPKVFRSSFANDLSTSTANLLYAVQRPVTFGALNETSTEPAWKTIPSWYVLGTVDKVIPPSEQLKMAKRAGSHVTKVKGSHLSMVSRPGAVKNVIEKAARATD